MNTSESTPFSKKSFKITGILYLLVIFFAGFSQGFVRETLYVPGDALLSATNIIESVQLFRSGLAADLLAFIIDAIISVLLYQMLKPHGKTLALISASLRLVAHPAIGSLNLLNHYMALHVLSGADFLGSFTPDQLQSMSLMFMDAHRNGYLIAGGFFGVHLATLGALLWQSGVVPKFFAAAVSVAAIGYLIETFGDFLYPGNEVWLAWLVGLTAAVGEVGFALFLTIKGASKTYLEKD